MSVDVGSRECGIVRVMFDFALIPPIPNVTVPYLNANLNSRTFTSPKQRQHQYQFKPNPSSPTLLLFLLLLLRRRRQLLLAVWLLLPLRLSCCAGGCCRHCTKMRNVKRSTILKTHLSSTSTPLHPIPTSTTLRARPDLHELDVSHHGRLAHHVTCLRVVLMPVHTLNLHSLPIDQ